MRYLSISLPLNPLSKIPLESFQCGILPNFPRVIQNFLLTHFFFLVNKKEKQQIQLTIQKKSNDLDLTFADHDDLC